MGEREVIAVSGSVACCTGPEGAGHTATVISIEFDRISVCPNCGRRFRRKVPPKVDPAVWPKEE